jgi:hypothetical protein
MNKRGKNKGFSHYNFFPKNRKGSHVEVIIAFIIFVTFIIFIFASIKSPVTRQEDKKNIFDKIEPGMIHRVSSDMTMITVTLPSGGGQCSTLDNFLDDMGIGENILVKNSSGEEVAARLSGNSLVINRTNINDEFFKIYYSEELSILGPLEPGLTCAIVTPKIWLTKTNEYVFEKKFHELMLGTYEALKAYLDVPKGVNFGYGIILSNGTIIESQIENVSTNIYIREKPIEYVSMEGNISEGYLKTTIW